MVRLFVGVCPAVSVVHDGQGPAPAGELAGDRDVGHDRSLLAVGEVQPPLVQPLVAGVSTGSGRRGCQLLSVASFDDGGVAVGEDVLS